MICTKCVQTSACRCELLVGFLLKCGFGSRGKLPPLLLIGFNRSQDVSILLLSQSVYIFVWEHSVYKVLWKRMFFPVLFSSTKRFTFLLVILNVIELDLDIWAVSSRRCRSNKILFSLNENLAACYGVFKEIWLFRGCVLLCRATDAWTDISTRSWCWPCVPFSHQFCRTAAWD